MIFFTDMSVRIGIAAPGTMIATIKRILGKPWGVVAGLSVFFITLCFSVGNAAGSGLALSMLFGGSALLWTAVCTVGVAFVLLMRNIYTAVERILLVLVAMMAVGFIASAFLAGPDWGAGVGGMVPSFPPGAETPDHRAGRCQLLDRCRLLHQLCHPRARHPCRPVPRRHDHRHHPDIVAPGS